MSPHAESESALQDGFPTAAFSSTETPLDYIVVGSGAGGAPLAARLALAGMQVLVVDAGSDPGGDGTQNAEISNPLYYCPGLHAAATEPTQYDSDQDGIQWDFWVQHSTTEPPVADSKLRTGHGEGLRQLYPRAKAIGGCTAHHALIAVVPPDDDWRYIAELTGDNSWSPDRMRQIYSTLERSRRGRHPTRLGNYWEYLLDLWDPGRHAAARRGASGWLDVALSDPQIALDDRALLRVITSVAMSGDVSPLSAVWRWIKRFVAGRFYQDLDLNDARTIDRAEAGVALLPLAVSFDRPVVEATESTARAATESAGTAPHSLLRGLAEQFGFTTPGAGRGQHLRRRGGTRRGPREFLLETRDRLNRRAARAASSSTRASAEAVEDGDTTDPNLDFDLGGRLWILTEANVRRVIFQKVKDVSQAVGIEVDSGTEGRKVIFARREIILCAGAFSSPQILMLSGIGDRDHLKAFKIKGLRDERGAAIAPHVHLPGVGQNLRDRYEIGVISRMESNWESLTGARFDPAAVDDPALSRWRETRDGVYATNGGAIAVLRKSRVRTSEERETDGDVVRSLPPDLFIMGFPIAFRGYYPGWSRDLLNDRSDTSSQNPGQPEQRNLWSWTILKAWSHNAGEVRLRSDDPAEQPDVNFHYFERQDSDGVWQFDEADPDLDALMDAVCQVRQINVAAAKYHKDGNSRTAEIQPGPGRPDNSPGLRDWIRAEAWGHHACGTCRIGSDAWTSDPSTLLDRGAVIDSQFRVHGVQNLRVVDASVFPRIPGYFISVPIFMVAEKAAQTILAESVGIPRELRSAEGAAISQRRLRARCNPPPPLPNRPPRSQRVAAPDKFSLPPQTVGLALSGGGIRSATLCLGVLQALAGKGRIRWIDYLSTASGGGYIGAFVGSLFARSRLCKRPDPCADVQDCLKNSSSSEIHWIRRNAQYLVSSGTSDWWQWLTIYWRNTTTTLLVVGAFALAALGLLRIGGQWIQTVATYVFPGFKRFVPAYLLDSTIHPWTHGVLAHLSPWWLAVLGVLLLGVLPSAGAYWLAPRTSNRNPFDFHSLSAWIVVVCGCALSIVLPGGATFSVVAIVICFVALGWLCIVRLSMPNSNVRPKRPLGSIVRNRLTRGMTVCVTGLIFIAAGALLDTLARVIAAGAFPQVLVAWAGAITPFVPFLRRLAAAPAGNDPATGATQSLASKFPIVSTLLAIVLGGFLITTVDVVVHWIHNRDPAWSWWITLISVVLSVSLGSAYHFLNTSSLQAAYAARIARTFIGASNPLRHVASTIGDASNVAASQPGDDLPMEHYQPFRNGGPLHLIGVCVNETVDTASQRDIPDRKSLPMSIGPGGVSVGTRYHSRWIHVDPRYTPWTIRFRDWLNDAEPSQTVRALRAVGVSGGEFHVLADKKRSEAFVEPLSLSQWIAISGAAFGTGHGRLTTKGASLLAGVSNARLGYWWDSGLNKNDRPGVYAPNLWRRMKDIPRRLVNMQAMLLAEWLGLFPGPAHRLWNLSDGGHFDNTAVYELVRRRVEFIVAVDASADPTLRFDDLAELIRQVRIDFCAEVNFIPSHGVTGLFASGDVPAWIQSWIAPSALGDLNTMRAGNCHAALARVTWSGSPQVSWLLYVKATVTNDESVDVLNQKVLKPAFPSDATVDQFFDEAQWECYRKLGQHVGDAVFK